MPAVLYKAKGQNADSIFPRSRGIPPQRNVGRLAPACLWGSGKRGGCSSGHKIIIIWHLIHQSPVPPKGNTSLSVTKKACTVPKRRLPIPLLKSGSEKRLLSVSYRKNANCNDNLVKGSASEGIYPTILVKLSNPRPPGSNCIWPPTIQTIIFLIFLEKIEK